MIRSVSLQDTVEEALQKSTKAAADYRRALEESFIVAATDQKGIINYANDNFCKISKYSREELIGQDHRMINSGFHCKAFIKNIWTTIAKGEIWRGELKNKAKDGTFYWVDTTIVPFLNDEGKPYEYVAIRNDITNRKETEERLAKSLKEISDYKHALDESAIVAITNQKGIINYVNDNFCKISKYSAAELIGQDHRIINSGFHSKEFMRSLLVTIANGKIWRGEIKNRAKDNSHYWVDTTIVPFLNEQGKPYQYVAIRADITERKRLAELLITNNEIAFQNEEKERRAIALIMANEALTAQNKEKEKLANELIIANKELAFQIEEKEKRATELIIANQELAFQNNEKEKRAGELIESAALLELANQEMEAFSYSISHDLRAPLRAVNGYANMLEEDYAGSFDDEGRRLLNVVQNNAKKMGILIDDLLEFSRLGKKEVNKSLVDMKALSLNVWNDLSKAPGFKARLKLNGLQPVMADHMLITQVLVNLLSNAVKYSANSTEPVIEITSKEEKGTMVYAIADNGVGFNMKYVHKLFGVFQRLHTAEEFEGTGVGLAIVHRIVTKHGGKAWAEGSLGKGATFYFSLPL